MAISTFTHKIFSGYILSLPRFDDLTRSLYIYIYYNYLSKVNHILSDKQRTKGETLSCYNQIIYDEPERDNCIIIC